MIRKHSTRLLWTLAVLGGTAYGQEAYKASVEVDPSRVTGKIEQDIYGQYLEHVKESDECIYPSIWDNTSPKSDSLGLRKDVMAVVKDMNVPVIRWPGGSFANTYHWENGIGARDKRPVVKNKHWGGNENHQFGTDEFLQWCEKTGVNPYVNINLGSGTLDEALRWLEYCNGDATTEQGKRRASNGHAEAYNVTYWGVGNEHWGKAETGASDATTYGKNLMAWGTALKKQDPSIRILGVGSDDGADPKWDTDVLEQASGVIDYLTLHAYSSAVNEGGDQYEAVVFSPNYFDFRIRGMLKTIDDFKAAHGVNRDIRISMDEWAIRRFQGPKGTLDQNLRRKAPRTVEDMLFVAGTLNVMVRHSPRIAMANYVFLINGHAPLLVNGEQVVKTPLYHVFRQYAGWMNGQALEVKSESPIVTAPPPMIGGASHKNYPKGYDRKEGSLLDTAAALRADGSIVISLINRHRSDPAEVALKLPAGYKVKQAWTLGDADPKAANDFEHPDRVVPVMEEVKAPVSSWTCAPKTVVMLSCVKEN